jgi:ATP-dependent Lhr-like helicase
VRTGDTDGRTRLAQRPHPAEILVTTPESLYLLLASGAREALRTVETVIIDEVHALAGTKRGVHLAAVAGAAGGADGRPRAAAGRAVGDGAAARGGGALSSAATARARSSTRAPPKLDLRSRCRWTTWTTPAARPPAVTRDARGLPGHQPAVFRPAPRRRHVAGHTSGLLQHIRANRQHHPLRQQPACASG